MAMGGREIPRTPMRNRHLVSQRTLPVWSVPLYQRITLEEVWEAPSLIGSGHFATKVDCPVRKKIHIVIPNRRQESLAIIGEVAVYGWAWATTANRFSHSRITTMPSSLNHKVMGSS